MKIIDFESKSWFFLCNEKDYYIDASCNLSFVGFNMLIKLNTSELNAYQTHGRDYLDSLVKNIQQYALSEYKDRNVKGSIERVANEVIIKFLEDNSQ